MPVRRGSVLDWRILNTVLLLNGGGCSLLSLTDLVRDVLLLLVDVEESRNFLQVVEAQTRELLLQLLQEIRLQLLDWIVFAGEV